MISYSKVLKYRTAIKIGWHAVTRSAYCILVEKGKLKFVDTEWKCHN
jgi:hypothetical protein